MKRFLLTILLFSLIPSVGEAQNSSADKKARLEKEIALLEEQIKENGNKKNSALSSLTLVRKQINNRKKLLTQSEIELKSINSQLSDAKARIKQTQAKLDTLSKYYSRLILNAYKNRDARVWYMYILASENIGQGIHRFNYLKSLSTQMNVQGQKIRQAETELKEKTEQMKALQKKAESARDARQKEMIRLQKEEQNNAEIIKTLQKDRAKYQKQLTDKRKQVEALNRQISQMVSSSSPSTKNKKPIDIKLSKEFASNKGKLPWPVRGPVIEDFGQHYHPVYKAVKLPFNNGITISSKGGSAVKAVFDGDVRQVIVMPGYNKCVLVQHGEYFSFYCKLGSVSVKAKDKVKTGQTIGTVDTNGENQFHFQIWKGRNPEDPEIWLR